MLSPSDIVIRPSLTDRLAAKAQVEPPPLPEPTPTTMAERFAPEAQKAAAEAPVRPMIEPRVMPGLVPPPRAASAGRGLLLASVLVSLVPTALILLLLWQGAIKLPGPAGRSEGRRAGAVRR